MTKKCRIYTVCGVSQTPNDESIVKGDKVVVMGYDGETEVYVVDVMDKYESELALPIDRYKKIVRKA